MGAFSATARGKPADLLPAPAARKSFRLLWLSCDDTDRLLDAARALHQALDEEKIPHVWHVDTGGHTWPVWKNGLYLLAQRLFRDRTDAP